MDDPKKPTSLGVWAETKERFDRVYDRMCQYHGNLSRMELIDRMIKSFCISLNVPYEPYPNKEEDWRGFDKAHIWRPYRFETMGREKIDNSISEMVRDNDYKNMTPSQQERFLKINEHLNWDRVYMMLINGKQKVQELNSYLIFLNALSKYLGKEQPYIEMTEEEKHQHNLLEHLKYRKLSWFLDLPKEDHLFIYAYDKNAWIRFYNLLTPEDKEKLQEFIDEILEEEKPLKNNSGDIINFD